MQLPRSKRHLSLVPVLVTAIFWTTAPPTRAQCPEWTTDFEAPGFTGQILDSIVFDDGTGPALYVCGDLRADPASPNVGVARWTATGWTPVGTWIGDVPSALAVFDAGTGPKLYAAGKYFYGSVQQDGIGHFDGSNWVIDTPALPPVFVAGSPTSALFAMEVFDSGSGPRLWVGGTFSDGVTPRNVAEWTGTAWNYAGGGLRYVGQDGRVRDLLVFDDGAGGGPALYACGWFTHGGGIPLAGAHVARTYGTTWTGLGSALGSPSSGEGTDLEIHDDGVTRRLAIGGRGLNLTSSQLWTWDGVSLTATGPEVPGPSASLASVPPGSVHAPGIYMGTGAVSSQFLSPLHRWDGSVWTDESSGLALEGVSRLGKFDFTGAGPNLFATDLGRMTFRSGAEWKWPLGGGADNWVTRMVSFRAPGKQAELFVGGFFHVIGGVGTYGFGRFDGQRWHRTFPDGVRRVDCLAAFDDGTGPKVFVSGLLTATGGVSLRRYDGTAWTNLPTLPGAPFGDTTVLTFSSWNDAGAQRTLATVGNQILVLAPTTWVSLLPNANGPVRALTPFDDGGGEALFIGGDFSSIGGAPTRGIGRLRNATLDSIGLGVPTGTRVVSFVVHDDGSGGALYACGTFPTMNGIPCGGIARWNGTTWSALGSGTDTVNITAMAVQGEGAAARLVATGTFSNTGSAAGTNVAAWDGTTWTPLGTGTSVVMFPSPTVTAVPALVTTYDAGDGRGADVYVAGAFTHAGARTSTGIARYASCGGDVSTFCHADVSGTTCPCGNDTAVGDRAGCRNSSGRGATLRATGRASLTNDSLVLEADTIPNGIGLFFHGASQVAGGAGVPFGDGLKCTGGPFVRLGVRTSPTSLTQFPGGIGASVSAAGMLATPGKRYYQMRYRDTAPFCTSETFNYTNGVTIDWTP